MRSTKSFGIAALVVSALFGQQQGPPPPAFDPNQGPQAQDAAGPPDEPGRPVGRISVLSGEASVRRGDADWVAAALNAPLMAGDAVSVAPSSAAEMQFDAANFARLAGDSEARISELENGRYQIQLAKGLVTWRVLRQSNAAAEISTPSVAVRPLGTSAVRVEVAPDGTTRVIVRHGEAEVATQKGTERVREGNMMLVRGSADDPEFQVEYAPAADQWDTWSDQRDAFLTRAQSPRYVSQDIYGTEDLDQYGRWNNDPAYGDVWTPNVAADWAPYRDGRWVWEDYYGWTWIDASPWGWAPFHYGSWYWRTNFGWSWFPGHRYERCWWRPALVGFVGFGGGGFGVGFGVGFGNIGWVPLAPYERFHPWYGRGGWGGRNGINNYVVRNANLTNVYRNSRFNNGVTAVSSADFGRGNFRNRVNVSGQLQQASVMRGGLPVTPTSAHLNFGSRGTGGGGPRADFNNQRFFSRMPAGSGAAQRTPFGQQQNAVRSAVEGRQFGNSGAIPRGNSSPGWQRFGSPQTTEPRFSQPQGGAARPQGNSWQQQPRSFEGARGFGGQSRSVEVAPPIVHQRQNAPAWQGRPAPAPAPSYNRGQQGNFGNPGYRQAPSAPPRQAPSAPAYRQAPAPSFNGGGGQRFGGGGGGGQRFGGGGGAQRGGGGGGGSHGGGGGGGHRGR